MEIRKLTEDDLVSLAVLYKQFWGEESSLLMGAGFMPRQTRLDALPPLRAQARPCQVGTGWAGSGNASSRDCSGN